MEKLKTATPAKCIVSDQQHERYKEGEKDRDNKNGAKMAKAENDSLKESGKGEWNKRRRQRTETRITKGWMGHSVGKTEKEDKDGGGK